MEDCSRLSDHELLSSLKTLARAERRQLPRLLARLAELGKRDAVLEHGFPSVFAYCVKELRWSESETARRLQAARAAHTYKTIYLLLASGRLTLRAVSLLAPHLRPDNHRALLKRALGKTTREVESLVAAIAPRIETRDCIRPLGPAALTTKTSDESDDTAGPLFAAQNDPVVVTPPAIVTRGAHEDPPPPARVEFTFTADAGLARDVERARELLRHKHPWCRLEDVFRDAVAVLLARIDPDRRAAASGAGPEAPAVGPAIAPALAAGSRTRVIPRRVKAAVWRRDEGACVFVSPAGRRCGSRVLLEYDHVRPWALGGASDDSANVRLLCRAHNGLAARRVFGRAKRDGHGPGAGRDF